MRNSIYRRKRTDHFRKMQCNDMNSRIRVNNTAIVWIYLFGISLDVFTTDMPHGGVIQREWLCDVDIVAELPRVANSLTRRPGEFTSCRWHRIYIYREIIYCARYVSLMRGLACIAHMGLGRIMIPESIGRSKWFLQRIEEWTMANPLGKMITWR